MEFLFPCSTTLTNLFTSIFLSCPTKKKNWLNSKIYIGEEILHSLKKKKKAKEKKQPSQEGLKEQWKGQSVSLGCLEWNS